MACRNFSYYEEQEDVETPLFFISKGLEENTPVLKICRNAYRYGFQGQEEDSETGLVNYKYRMHDPRIGRFFAVDPLMANFPWNSPYAFSENRVIDSRELEGLERLAINTETQGVLIYEGPKAVDVYKSDVLGVYDLYKTLPNGLPRSLNTNDNLILNRKGDYINSIPDFTIVSRTDNRSTYRKIGDWETDFMNDAAKREAAGVGEWLVGNDNQTNHGEGGASDTKAGLAMISVIVTVGTMGGSTVIEGAGYLTMRNLVPQTMSLICSLDDLSAGFTDSERTILEDASINLKGSGNLISGAKIALNLFNSKESLVNFVQKNGKQATLGVIGFINDQGNAYYGLYEINNEVKSDKIK
jgi:RHS repeat-associated protein